MDMTAATNNHNYAENWSLHPGTAQRGKRGITAKEQQV